MASDGGNKLDNRFRFDGRKLFIVRAFNLHGLRVPRQHGLRQRVEQPQFDVYFFDDWVFGLRHGERLGGDSVEHFGFPFVDGHLGRDGVQFAMENGERFDLDDGLEFGHK